MAEWDFYQANIDGKISSVYVNLDAYTETDTSKYSKLCWLFIRLKIERADGLSHDDEFDVLIEYEKCLIDELSCGPIEFVGRITTDGMRQFYFYAADSFDFEMTIERFLDKQPSYQYQFGSRNNADWSQYRNVLYPGKYGLQQINARRKNA